MVALPGTEMVGAGLSHQVYEASCLKSVIFAGVAARLAKSEREMVAIEAMVKRALVLERVGLVS